MSTDYQCGTVVLCGLLGEIEAAPVERGTAVFATPRGRDAHHAQSFEPLAEENICLVIDFLELFVFPGVLHRVHRCLPCLSSPRTYRSGAFAFKGPSRNILFCQHPNMFPSEPCAQIRELTSIAQEAFLLQLLEEGFMHCDPHPGECNQSSLWSY